MAIPDLQTLPSVPLPDTLDPPSPVIIERVQPEIDGGRYPVKRVQSDILEVSADIFKDGHDKIAAVVKYRRADEDDWREAEMRLVDNDRWAGEILLTDNTRYVYTIEAFPDRWATWSDEIGKKLDAGQDVALELLEGRAIIAEALFRADPHDREILDQALAAIDSEGAQAATVRSLLAPEVEATMRRARSRQGKTVYDKALEVVVDRPAARFAAWYEMFPRSAGTDPTRGATFAEAAQRLPAIAEMGFDVVYLTPIHPIGTAFRKGKNNTLGAGEGDPGVPYAIGSEEGGHDAIEPGLGTLDEFNAFRGRAEALGMEVALDVAFQASPDHPWAKEHPEWFTIRPDGTIHYAENPPKKYQDIYPLNFDTPAWRDLWLELRRVILFWVENGVKTFRVDNPHTKSFAFWEWLIADVQHDYPDVIFLSEAFTRPKVMKLLAKAGFTQSYTYFTWRNFKGELEAYFTELTQSEMKEYYRGNLFPNTHDILPFILQEGGRPAFKMRLALAATLSSVYGIYSSYELCENTPVPGREEYLNSEKYEYKVWDWDRPGNIIPYITQINAIRREHPALQLYDNLRFYPSDDEHITAYGKATPDGEDRVLVIVNMDPFDTHETWLHLPLHEWDMAPDEPFQVEDLLTGETHLWHAHQHIRLDPRDEPARFYAVRPIRRVSYVEGCG
ncbi:MAG: alpha,4-glucan--maltose-phosphate maltosyltransferase [Thermomicrobiales bacterium]|jgi:starch synthase (maltosyl-transferring)|nr:alpha,4-glucan--maltose-phosphate maltosyltransferase [Thermomicrobiales bacterium]